MLNKPQKDIKDQLDLAYERYARPDFIPNDPIQIPHRFSGKEDIEIAGFLAATIAWGQRITIINNAKKLIIMMDGAPHDFIVHHKASDRKRLASFVHRTFNAVDAMYFFEALQHLYLKKGGLETAFIPKSGIGIKERLMHFHQLFFELEHLTRTRKHVSNPEKGSSAKRLNMYLRWMVRSPKEGVDFGIWKNINPEELMMPLDVHTGTVGRRLGLLKRKQDDWKAVEELTSALRKFDQADPVKYDFALFGLGIDQRINP
ncbi:MAG: TIGR02757 family protein [Salibacteraceae bacterium]